MGTYSIQKATCTLPEATAILDVERRTFGVSPYSPAELLAVMRRPTHHTCVCLYGEAVVGFCSSFDTPTDRGSRLEVDLLAVLPDHQNRGLGSGLIAQAVAEARARGVHDFRGIAAQGNIPSQRAFARAGFLPLSQHELLLYPIAGTVATPLPDHGYTYNIEPEEVDAPRLGIHLFDARGGLAGLAECLYVYTFCYEGLWIEQARAEGGHSLVNLARAVVETAKTMRLDQVGYLLPVPAIDEDRLPWLRAGYQVLGQYLALGLSEDEGDTIGSGQDSSG